MFRFYIVITLIASLFGSAVYADQRKIPDYPTSREEYFWKVLYPTGFTFYCGEEFTNSKKATSGKKINIEHVFAASWIAEALGCGTRKECQAKSVRFNHAEADLHNLYPVISRINSSRRNLPFGIIEGNKKKWGCSFERSKDLVEPRDEIKGDIARSILYIADEYQLSVPYDMKPLLLKWHKKDPPSNHEKSRNDLIFKIQGTRNKYIDNW